MMALKQKELQASKLSEKKYTSNSNVDTNDHKRSIKNRST